MNTCINCHQPTSNPKFCSKSCACTYNNLHRQPIIVANKKLECSICQETYEVDGRVSHFICKGCKQKKRESIQYDSTVPEGQKCDYGCDGLANFKFKSGKYCCSEHYSECLGIRDKKKSRKLEKVTSKESVDVPKVDEVLSILLEIQKLEEERNLSKGDDLFEGNKSQEFLNQCDYGCGSDGIFTLKNGKHCCHAWPSGCSAMKEINRRDKVGKAPVRKDGKSPKTGHTGAPAWNKGLTKETDVRIKIAGLRYKYKVATGEIEKPGGICADPVTEAVRKKKISNYAKMVGLGGYVKGSGRGRKGWYKGYWCDSTYELAYVIYCLEKGIKFERNKEGFEYTYRERIHKYYPDFIENGDEYIEIKGYMNGEAHAKLKQFPMKIRVITGAAIDKIVEFSKACTGVHDLSTLYEK